MARVYLAAFPESLPLYAGHPVPPTFVADAFLICLDAEPGSCIVAETDASEVVGFIVAPSHLMRIYRVALTHGHLFRMSWRYITGQYRLGLRPVVVAGRNLVRLFLDARQRRPALDCDARILAVGVRPDFRRRGIGTALCRAGLDYLLDAGAAAVGLQVRPDNPAAIGVYKELGFAVRGRTRNSQGEWLIMVKDQGGAPRA